VTAKTGHHKVTADGIALAIGLAANPYTDYFEGVPAEA
jgi:hypothetical protein